MEQHNIKAKGVRIIKSKNFKLVTSGSLNYGDVKYNKSIEKDRHRVPTEKDYEDTYKLIRSFRINIKLIDIPKFNVMYELYNWRLQVIKNFICS